MREAGSRHDPELQRIDRAFCETGVGERHGHGADLELRGPRIYAHAANFRVTRGVEVAQPRDAHARKVSVHCDAGLTSTQRLGETGDRIEVRPASQWTLT